MKVLVLLLGVCMTFLFQFCQARGSGQAEKIRRQSSVNNANAARNQVTEISKEAAIAMVTQDVIQVHRSSEGYNFVVCEPVELWAWRILVEPKDAASKNDLIEYIVLKLGGGRIVSKRGVSLNYSFREGGEKSSAPANIDREAAIAIARRDAARVYGSLAEYKLVVGELRGAWRVVYTLEDSTGGGPAYVIDKQTGKIVNKAYSQ